MTIQGDPQFVLSSPRKLSNKIVGLLVLFFLAALTVIILTLLVSWNLEGGAAAINDAGSQRMRSWRIAHLLEQGARRGEGVLPVVVAAIGSEVADFEHVLGNLERGDPGRPLAPPRDEEGRQRLQGVKEKWFSTMRPLVDGYVAASDGDGRADWSGRYGQAIPAFVAELNALVSSLEYNYAFNTNLLRSLQILLAVLAVIGTALLIRFFFVMVIRPVDNLYDGIRRMAGNDLAVRLPVETHDEFGVLAQGFNRMAEHLQEVHATLEERVAAKTSSLEQRNLELGLLYEVTAFVNELRSIEDLCAGFLRRIKGATRADAGSVRLHNVGNDEVYLLTHEGLSAEFVSRETSLRCGECLCGEVVEHGTAMVADTQSPPAGMTLRNCAREGIRVATVFTISHNRQTLGVFNLYFQQERIFHRQEIVLLETLGQHLGVAIENQRLRSRERQHAVSEERNLLAQELHDSIAQGLAFLNIQVQLLRDSLGKNRMDEVHSTVEQIQEGVQESYEDVRELLVHFRTRMQQTDLDSAIHSTLERFARQTGIEPAFIRTGTSAPLLPDEQVQVMHIVQEALSNVRKHAHASAVDVKVERSAAGMIIEISDNGRGFAPADISTGNSERHVGLKIMEERARRVGGRCTIESAPGEGTRIVLALMRQPEEIV